MRPLHLSLSPCGGEGIGTAPSPSRRERVGGRVALSSRIARSASYAPTPPVPLPLRGRGDRNGSLSLEEGEGGGEGGAVFTHSAFRVLCAHSTCPSPTAGARGSERLPLPRGGRGWGGGGRCLHA